MEQVVLPEEQKEMLLKTVDNFAKFRQYRKREGLEDIMSYGAGLVIMLCGASGTGKTMTVNAVAHHLGEPQYPPYGSEHIDASSLLIICIFYVHFQSMSLNSFLHCWMWLLLCC
jgi:SpoVK/Ycf46/Vps4 family AAA+-type ATPase